MDAAAHAPERLADLDLHAPYSHASDLPDPAEYVISVDWLASTSLETGFKQRGLVSNQNSAVLLRADNPRHRTTVALVLDPFGLEEDC